MKEKYVTPEVAARIFAKAMDGLRKAVDDVKDRLERVAPGNGALIDEAVARSLDGFREELAGEGAKLPAVPSDFDDGREGDQQAIWNGRLRHLGDRGRARVDNLEQRLIEMAAGRDLKRNLRGGVGWRIDGSDLISVDLALACPTDVTFKMVVDAYAATAATGEGDVRVAALNAKVDALGEAVRQNEAQIAQALRGRHA